MYLAASVNRYKYFATLEGLKVKDGDHALLCPFCHGQEAFVGRQGDGSDVLALEIARHKFLCFAVCPVYDNIVACRIYDCDIVHIVDIVLDIFPQSKEVPDASQSRV